MDDEEMIRRETVIYNVLNVDIMLMRRDYDDTSKLGQAL